MLLVDRAGRDGQQSYAVMYWDHSDVQRQLAIASRGDFNGSASTGSGGGNTARVSVIETLMRQMESFADQRYDPAFTPHSCRPLSSTTVEAQRMFEAVGLQLIASSTLSPCSLCSRMLV